MDSVETMRLEPLETINEPLSNSLEIQTSEELLSPIPQLTVDNEKMIQVMEETSTSSLPPTKPLQSTEINVSPAITPIPKGSRWAISSPSVDLSGQWKILVDDHFKKDYDTYLMNLGQPSLVRTVATSIVEMTTEEVRQEKEGRVLHILGKNLRGVWERTLVASGSDIDYDHGDDQDHVKTPLVTADQEQVQAEAWWESEGTVHRSFLRGGKKYGGGDFESKRYLVENGNVLVCESTFHPRDSEKSPAKITWKFARI